MDEYRLPYVLQGSEPIVKTINLPCVACTHSVLAYFGSRESYDYYRCRYCGTLQISPLPDSAALAQAYQSEYTKKGNCQAAPEVRNEAARPQFEAIATALQAYCTPTRALDYGCGWGGLLDTLAARGIHGEGLELSSEMADYCTEQGHIIYRGGFDSIPDSVNYDAIVLSSVFEHLVDHAGWFTDAARILKPGGIIVSLQPTASFAVLGATLFRLGIKRIPLPQLHQIFCPPWHIALFSLKGMALLAERNGFEVVEIRPAPLQRGGGMTGVIQRALSIINTLAHPVFGLSWPLWTGHIFVMRRK